MKILILNHEFPPVGGGAAKVSEDFAGNLARMGHEVVVITSRYKGQTIEEYKNGYLIKRAIGARKFLYSGSISEYLAFTVHGIFYLLNTIKKDKPDMIYAFFAIPSGFLALLLNKAYKIPYYVLLRGIDIPGFYGGPFSFLNKLFSPLTRYVCSNSEKVVVNSESSRKFASHSLGLKKIYIIPNLIDLEKFSSPITSLENAKTRLIFAGRLNKQKGIDYLLEAIFILSKKTQLPFVLEIVGDGPEKWALANKAGRLKITKYINFLDWMDREKLIKYYQGSDLFISPSLDEAFSNTILEAMACGLPIIASDIPAHREIIKNNINGILVRPMDAKALSSAIIKLINKPDLMASMKASNIEDIKKYDIKHLGSYLENLVK